MVFSIYIDFCVIVWTSYYLKLPSVQTIKQPIEWLTCVQTFQRSFMQHERMSLTVLGTEKHQIVPLCPIVIPVV